MSELRGDPWGQSRAKIVISKLPMSSADAKKLQAEKLHPVCGDPVSGVTLVRLAPAWARSCPAGE